MKTVVIIGGGYSGTFTSIQLLKKSERVSVKLINCNYPVALGVAYSTDRYEHLLNVPSSKMSAFADEPDHFVKWLRSNENKYQNEEFVPRFIYGKYLTSILDQYRSNDRLEIINAKATNILFQKGHYAIHLNDNTTILADDVVLATGNFLPAPPKIKNTDFFQSPSYFKDPWNNSFLKNIDLEKNILLIGTGLTMTDCILSLQNIGFKGKIYAVSPRGYTPTSQEKTSHYSDFYDEMPGLSLIELLKNVRKHLKNASSKNISMHSVIDSLRPHVQKIWIKLSVKEKQQFISHIRHIWGVARHRLPPELYKSVSELTNSGQLEIIGARISDIIEQEDTVIAKLKLRKDSSEKTIRISRVINCTGPQANYFELKDELMSNLIANGLIIPDELRMGIKATVDGLVISKENKNIYAIGSLLRGVLWETTAVPELRIQAENIAKQIIDNI